MLVDQQKELLEAKKAEISQQKRANKDLQSNYDYLHITK
jgi:hypothetical protein